METVKVSVLPYTGVLSQMTLLFTPRAYYAADDRVVRWRLTGFA